MGEVRYSINGKYFKDYGVYVSSSLGLLDALKRKPIKTFNWPEYHGESLDLSNPKYEAREIVLNCFVTGDNYEEMFINFRNIVMSEFQKSGTQRLLVEAFGLKALPYEVYLIDDVKLLKEFKNSKTVGVFQLKLIEPNPIKKVLYLVGNTLNLSYNSTQETEIFYGNGTKDLVKTNASISGKNLTNRIVSDYLYSGRNLILNSDNEWNLTSASWVYLPLSQKLIEGKTYIFSCEYFENTGSTNFDIGLNIINGYNYSIKEIPINQPFVATAEMATKTHLSFANQLGTAGSKVAIHYPKLEVGYHQSDYTPAPEDEKFIIIAGDIDGITNLTTNAVVLWEKL